MSTANSIRDQIMIWQNTCTEDSLRVLKSKEVLTEEELAEVVNLRNSNNILQLEKVDQMLNSLKNMTLFYTRNADSKP